MIYEVEGDILLSGTAAIAHGVAANDPMNQGLAKSLHSDYPAMHKDFHHWCHQQHPKPGSAWVWGGTEGIRIINLITQEGGYKQSHQPGKATVSSVNHALRALKKLIAKENFTSVALPRLATGQGTRALRCKSGTAIHLTGANSTDNKLCRIFHFFMGAS